jgi:phosphoribosylamine---glycine ligase
MPEERAPSPTPPSPPAAAPSPPPRRYLFVSDIALIHDLAWQIKREGYEVRYFIKAKGEKEVADGFLEKSEDWERDVEWADVVVFDDTGFGPKAEALRKAGKPVIGGSVYTDRLEEDREFGQAELTAAGLNTIPSFEFSSFDEAIAHVKANPDRYVVKPSGKAQSEKVLSYVGQEEDGLDILGMLEHYKKAWGTKIKSFQVQRYVAGVEVAVGGFFDGKNFVLPVNVNFEHKRMFNDDIGPSTGEMGTSMFWTGENRLYRETLGRLRDRLAASGYVGYFDINCIATGRGLYPLEATSRFGYPTISIQMEGITSNWGEFLYTLAKGEAIPLKTKRGFQVGVVIAVPPFPFTDREAYERYSGDAPIIFRKPATSGVHIGDVKAVNGEWLLASPSGYALVVTGSGPTMEDARREAYSRVRNVLIPNMFYRTDIGSRWSRDGDLLYGWGYLS